MIVYYHGGIEDVRINYFGQVSECTRSLPNK